MIFRQTPLYTFARECEQKEMEKKILDCGAGGTMPPLALFHELGYETHGIDISDNQIQRAKNFEEEYNMKLNITKGDMRELPFDDESFSFAFSYNTIFHLSKVDIKKSMIEINRILKKGGLVYVNFMSIEDGLYGQGEEISKGEFLQKEGDRDVTHTFFEEDEIMDYFPNYEIIMLQKRNVNYPKIWGDYVGSYYDIIAEKKE